MSSRRMTRRPAAARPPAQTECRVVSWEEEKPGLSRQARLGVRHPHQAGGSAPGERCMLRPRLGHGCSARASVLEPGVASVGGVLAVVLDAGVTMSTHRIPTHCLLGACRVGCWACNVLYIMTAVAVGERVNSQRMHILGEG